jgi:HEAT repeat protein
MLWLTLRKLKSQDVNTRLRAVRELGESRDPRVTDILLPLLKDAFVHSAVVASLGKLGDRRAVPALMKELRSSVGYTSPGVVHSLNAIDPDWRRHEDARKLIADLENALLRKEEDENRRIVAAGILGEIGDPHTFEPLLETYKGRSSSRLVQAALKAIVKIAGVVDVAEVLNAMLQSADVESRKDAARILGMTRGNSRSLGLLIEALDDEHSGIRMCAAEALGNISDERAVEPLLRLCENDPDRYQDFDHGEERTFTVFPVRDVAKKALERIRMRTK